MEFFVKISVSKAIFQETTVSAAIFQQNPGTFFRHSILLSHAKMSDKVPSWSPTHCFIVNKHFSVILEGAVGNCSTENGRCVFSSPIKLNTEASGTKFYVVS